MVKKRHVAAAEERRLPESSCIGCRVKHFWEGDAQWYEGRIVDQVDKTTYVVRYDDGEYHQVRFDDAKEIMLIGRGLYLVKQPGHCAWPAAHFELTSAAANSNKVIGFDGSKCYAIFFQTLQYVWVPKSPEGPPILSDIATVRKATRKKAGILVEKLDTDTVRSHPEILKQLEKPGKKSEALLESLDLAEAEIQEYRQIRAAWKSGKVSVEDLALMVPLARSEAPEPPPPPPPQELSYECAECHKGNCNEMKNAARCDSCLKIYHLTCWGGPEIKKAPAATTRGKRWYCADCLTCDRCDRTQRTCGPANRIARPRLDVVNRHGDFFMTNGLLPASSKAAFVVKAASADENNKKIFRGTLCRECLEHYRTGKLCATCQEPWNDDDERMIKCDGPGCRLWSHAACYDLDEEEYQTITQGTHPLYGLEFLCAAGCAAKVATRVVNKLADIDELQLFSAPVDAAIAPTYRDVIKHPMDLSTMRKKAADGLYHSTQAVRNDAELMCVNAVTFNRPGDKFWREACRYFDAATKAFDAIDAGRSHASAEVEDDDLDASSENGDDVIKREDMYSRPFVKNNRRSAPVEPVPTATEEKLATIAAAVATSSADGGISAVVATTSGDVNNDDGNDNDTNEADAAVAVVPDATVAAAPAAAHPPDTKPTIRRKSVPSEHAATMKRLREDYQNKVATQRASRAATVTKDALAGTAVKRVERIDRVPCLDPASCVAVAEIGLDRKEASLVHSWLDVCLVCGSGEAATLTGSNYEYDGPLGGELLFCVDCGEAFHGFCAFAPIATMDYNAKLTWRCPNCKICELCGLCKEEDESRLVYCDVCDKGYHLDCIEPTIPTAPAGRWICGLCVDCRFCDADARLDPLKRRWSSRSDACKSCLAASRTDATLAPFRGICAALDACLVDDKGAAATKMCGLCAARFHDDCALAFLRTTPDSKGQQVCLRCVSPTPVYATHLGAGNEAWRCVAACANIQRRRFLAKRQGAKFSGSEELTQRRRRRPLLRGWTEFFSSWETSPRARTLGDAIREAFGGDWADLRQCSLCKRRGDCVDAGRLVPTHDDKNVWVHLNCARWSSEVYEIDRSLVKVRNAIARSRTLRCTKCNLPGATMGCCAQSCRKNYHFRCGAVDGAICIDGVRVLCATCYAKQEVSESGGSECGDLAEVDDVAGDEPVALKCPAPDEATQLLAVESSNGINDDVQKAGAMDVETSPAVPAETTLVAEKLQQDGGGNDSVDVAAMNDVGEPAVVEGNSQPASECVVDMDVSGEDGSMSAVPREVGSAGEAEKSAVGALPAAAVDDAEASSAVAGSSTSQQDLTAVAMPVEELDDSDLLSNGKVASSQLTGLQRITHVAEHMGDVGSSLVVPSQLDFERARCKHDPYEYFIKRRAKEVQEAKLKAAPAPAYKKPTAKEYAAMQGDEPIVYLPNGRKKPVARKPRQPKPVKVEDSKNQQSNAEDISPDHARWLDNRVLKARELGDTFRIGALVVLDPGTIAPVGYRFHTRDRVFPIGFRATRIFWSAIRPVTRVVYVCEIVDGGQEETTSFEVRREIEHFPIFRITALDDPDTVYESLLDPRQAVSKLRRAVERCNNYELFRKRSAGGYYSPRHYIRSYGLGDDGASFFGLSIPAVRAKIEDLPYATSAALLVKPLFSPAGLSSMLNSGAIENGSRNDDAVKERAPPPATSLVAATSAAALSPVALPPVAGAPAASLPVTAAAPALPPVSAAPAASPTVAAAPAASPHVTAAPALPMVAAAPAALPPVSAAPAVSPPVAAAPATSLHVTAAPPALPMVVDAPEALPSVSAAPAVSPPVAAAPAALPPVAAASAVAPPVAGSTTASPPVASSPAAPAIAAPLVCVKQEMEEHGLVHPTPMQASMAAEQARLQELLFLQRFQRGELQNPQPQVHMPASVSMTNIMHGSAAFPPSLGGAASTSPSLSLVPNFPILGANGSAQIRHALSLGQISQQQQLAAMSIPQLQLQPTMRGAIASSSVVAPASSAETGFKRPAESNGNVESASKRQCKPASYPASKKNAAIKYSFCYVQPSVGEVLGAQRQIALRDAEVKANPSGCARAEPHDNTAEADRARITRSLVRAANSDAVPSQPSQTKIASDADTASASPFAGVVSAVSENRDKYRRMKAVPMQDRLEVRRSHIHGWGLFLKRDVRKDEFIVEYVGQIVRQSVGDKREKYYDDAGFGSCYLFRLDDNRIVDATRKGNVGRFINHCCKPNAYARVVNVEAQIKKIVIIALVDLKSGSEVMYDYKFPIEDDKVRCYCGAPNCRGFMN